VTQHDQILTQASKWREVGVFTYACKVDLEWGIRKTHRNSIKITDDLLSNPSLLPEDYNFLALDLENSEIVCLDIEGNPGSVEDFMEVLEEKSIDLSDFLVEKTLNNGLHIYFRYSKVRRMENIFAMELKRIKFDVLCRGKVFTFPSYLGKKRYIPMFNIEGKVNRDKIADIPSGIYNEFFKKR
jgi:hypothetical protein